MFGISMADASNGYYYGFLSTRQKHEYKSILKAILHRDKTVFFPIPISQRSLEGVLMAVLGDNHGLFWTDVNWIFTRYTFAEKDTGLIFGMEISYLMDEAEQKAVQVEIDRIAARIAGDVANLSGDLAKARHIFDWLVTHTTYIDMSESPHSQTIKGALIDGATACAGFSHAMAYLCGKAGLDCKFVWGAFEDEPHAWNHMVIDGRSLYCDVASSLLSDADGGYKPTETFFAMSSADLERFGLSFAFPQAAPFAPESDYTQWERSGGYSGSFDFDRCVWALAAAQQTHAREVFFSFTDGLDGFREGFSGDGCPGIEAVAGICRRDLAWKLDYVDKLGIARVRLC